MAKQVKYPTTAKGVLKATLELMEKYGEKNWIKGNAFEVMEDETPDKTDPFCFTTSKRLCYCLGGAATLASGVCVVEERFEGPDAYYDYTNPNIEKNVKAFHAAASLFGKANKLKHNLDIYEPEEVLYDYEPGINIFSELNDRHGTTFKQVLNALKKAINYKEGKK